MPECQCSYWGHNSQQNFNRKQFIEKGFFFLPNISDSNSKTCVCFFLSFSSLVFSDFFFCSFSCLIVDGFGKVLSDFPRLVDHQGRKRFGRGQMLHRGGPSEVRPGSGADLCCEVGTAGIPGGAAAPSPFAQPALGLISPGSGQSRLQAGREGITDSSSSPCFLLSRHLFPCE